MDRSKLPLSLLVALGLAPEACTTKEPRAHPCLSAPIDDGKLPPDGKQDPPVDACLKVMPPEPPPDPPVGPCLEFAEPPADVCLSPLPEDPDPPVGPCLRVMPDRRPDPPVGPCLKVMQPEPPVDVCLSVRPEPPRDRPPRKPDGGMASSSRHQIIERVRAALPPDVAARLPARDADDA